MKKKKYGFSNSSFTTWIESNGKIQEGRIPEQMYGHIVNMQ